MLIAYTLTKETVIVTPLTGDEEPPRAKKGSTVWLHSLAPTKKELRLIERFTAIPYESLDVGLEEEIRPYAEKEGHLEFVYRAPLLEASGDVVTEPLIVFLKGRFLITLAREKLKAIHDTTAALSANKRKFLLRGRPAAFLLHLIDAVNDDFLARIERITRVIDKLEQDPDEEKNYDQLYAASLTSAYFNRALIGNIEALNTLKKLHHTDLDADDRERFDDLHLEAMQILDTEKIQRELITNLFTFQNMLANRKVERKLRRLTVLAIIIAVPTMISGLYGMNLQRLPFAEHPQSFWIITSFMLIVILLFIVLFKALDWF